MNSGKDRRALAAKPAHAARGEAARQGKTEPFPAAATTQAVELDTARRALAATAEQLAAAQTEVFFLHEKAERLPAALSRIAVLENERNALRYRLDEAEQTLARFHRSFSWKITRPLRWVGRTIRRLIIRGRA